MSHETDMEIVNLVKEVYGIDIPGTWDGGYEEADLLRNFFLHETAEIISVHSEAQEKLEQKTRLVRSARSKSDVQIARESLRDAQGSFNTANAEMQSADRCMNILFGRGSHEGYVAFMEEARQMADSSQTSE